MTLERLLQPATVALVGASGTPGKWGYMMMRTLLDGGFGGRIAAVNGRGGEVQGHPAYPTVADLPVGPRRRAGHRRPRGLRRGGRGAGRAGVPARDPLRRRLRRARRRTARACRTGWSRRPGRPACGSSGPNCMSLFVARSRLNLTGIPDLRAGTARLRVPERQPGLRPRRAWAPERARAVALPEPRQPGRPGLRGRAGRGPRRIPTPRAVALYVEAVRPGRGRAFLEARPSPGPGQAGGRPDRRADGQRPPRLGVPHRGAPVRRPRAARAPPPGRRDRGDAARRAVPGRRRARRSRRPRPCPRSRSAAEAAATRRSGATRWRPTGSRSRRRRRRRSRRSGRSSRRWRRSGTRSTGPAPPTGASGRTGTRRGSSSPTPGSAA